jgi:TRAP-type transport system periplasmic protein
MRPVVVALLLAGTLGTARAEVEAKVIRMAAIAPDGTAWARELKALARDVEVGTKGAVRIKWYFGGIAGDEIRSIERVKQGQLDGAAGATFCHQLAPSLRVARVVGLYQSRDESLYIHNRLKPLVDPEFRKSGFVNLGLAVFGADALFSRTPVRSMADFRRSRYWIWSLDPIWNAELPAMGGKALPLDVTAAGRAYDEAKHDGFIALPSAALAYQWSTQARYFSNLASSYLTGCVVFSNTSFDALAVDHQQAVRSAVAKFLVRFNDVSRLLDESLLNGLFEKQGLKKVEVSPAFLAEFHEAASKARPALAELVPRELLDKVQTWLAEYRATPGKR